MRISKILMTLAVTAITANATAGTTNNADCKSQIGVGRYSNTVQPKVSAAKPSATQSVKGQK